MVGWLKKKLKAYYDKQVAQHVTAGDYSKPHFRLLTQKDKDDIQSKISTPIKWYRVDGTKRGYYIFPGFTIDKVKEVTGLTLNYLGGEWYVVEYENEH